MKRFIFRLEKVLDLRSYEEKQAQLKLAAQNAKCQILENEIVNLRQRKASAFLERGSAASDAFTLLAYENYGHRLDSQAQRKTAEFEKEWMKREELLELFLEAQKKRKVLDKIRDKRHQQWHIERNRQEVKKVDDIVTGAYSRKTHPLNRSEGHGS